MQPETAQNQSVAAPSLSVVVPVYRSETSLRALVERLLTVLKNRADDFEIILVNDGSPDRSWRLIEELARADTRIRGIDLMRNFGQHNAVLCGIRAARYDVIITLDADLQHPPEEIPSLLAKLAEGYDVVYGRPAEEKHSLFRRLGSNTLRYIVGHVLGITNAAQISALRAFRARLREPFLTYSSPLVFIDVMLTWSTTRITAVSVRHAERSKGKSSYSLYQLLGWCFTVITSFSTLPLRLASWIGFFFTLFGVGVLVYVIGVYLILGYSIPGFPFLASIIAIFSGAQLFALGIIGEYLSRIHFRLMDKPPFVVRDSIGFPPPNQNPLKPALESAVNRQIVHG
ncbi:MAG: glycosyltransferase family 2 protein [Lentisphaerae bacterium]|nr:glycosyltransferase family 2 protein [Lentisphaerota bacterium]